MLLLLLLSACAAPQTIEVESRDVNQSVTLRTPGVDSAHCFVQVGQDSVPVKTPARLIVPRSQEPLDINCFKGPHISGHTVVQSRFAACEAAATECTSCAYPEDVAVTMTIRAESLR